MCEETVSIDESNIASNTIISVLIPELQVSEILPLLLADLVLLYTGSSKRHRT
jgi:hypothetical protein